MLYKCKNNKFIIEKIYFFEDKIIMKLFYNLLNSINGIKIALKENSFILELVGGLFLVPYIIFIDISFSMKLIIIAVYFLLLAFEIINTSIEKLCNKITREIDNEIK